jgi:hypothetical protein
MGSNGRDRAKRRKHDAYYTPAWMVRALLRYTPIDLTPPANSQLRIFEPCVGDGAIVRELIAAGALHVRTNDIDPGVRPDFTFDAADPWPIERLGRRPHWTVSNPPWAMPKGKRPLPVLILQHALEHSLVVSLLLRITFLEPCENRGSWLQEHPPFQIIVLPRYSFTGDGKSDSATACWMTWLRPGSFTPAKPQIVIASDAERL